MRNVSDTICREHQNTRFKFNKLFYPESHAVYYETMWKNTVEPHRSQMTIYEGESKSKGKIHLTALIEVTVSNVTYHFST